MFNLYTVIMICYIIIVKLNKHNSNCLVCNFCQHYKDLHLGTAKMCFNYMHKIF